MAVFFCKALFAQQKNEHIKPFAAKDYPAKWYDIRYDSSNFKEFAIKVIHVLNVNYKPDIDITNMKDDPNNFTCRGWVYIKNNKTQKVVDTLYYADMLGGGGCSGIYMPSIQPRTDYFVVVKNGDYDGHLIIVDSLGNVTIEKGGGNLQISTDKRYLFSNYNSDIQAATIFDFNKHKTILTADSVLNGSEEPVIMDWYFKDNQYMAQVHTDREEGENPDTLHITVGIYNFDKHNITLQQKEKDYLQQENKLTSFDLYPFYDTYHSCNCGK